MDDCMKHIVLLPNTEKDSDYRVTILAAEVLKKAGAVIYAHEKHKALCFVSDVRFYSDAEFPKEAEGAIVFGGDGSILDAAHIAFQHDIPLLGVNLGRLGYLTEVEVSDIDSLEKLISDDYDIRNVRTLEVLLDGKLVSERFAVNEVVVSRGDLFHIADMKLSAGNDWLQYRADGLIIATPTGSTAYSLSAGGAVIDPSLDVISVTPICPHSFFSRSIVFSGDTEIKVQNMNTRGEDLTVAIDGREGATLSSGKTLTVRTAKKGLKVITLSPRPFIELLKKKMSF